MAAEFEYWTSVFGVGLDGFSDFDHDELNSIAAEGWEPVTLTAVHNGFAVVVMFRRALAPSARKSPPAKKASAAGAAKRGAPAAAAKKAAPAAAAKKAR